MTTRRKYEEGDTSDDSHEKIGEEYQASITDYNPLEDQPMENKEVCVWKPTPQNLDQIDEYLNTARFKYGYSFDQALALYTANKYDIVEAYKGLEKYSPISTYWSMQDKMMYEQAARYSNKNFRTIQQLVPHKSIGDLVTYYYNRKKLKDAKSHFDKLYIAKSDSSKSDSTINISPIGSSNKNKLKYSFIYENPKLWTGKDVPDIISKSNAKPSASSTDDINSFNKKDFFMFYDIYQKNNNSLDAAQQVKEKILKEYDLEIYKLKCIMRENQQKLNKEYSNLDGNGTVND